MSDADSFIQEVSEEVRRDRMFRLWRRFAPLVIGAIAAVVAGTAVLAWLDHSAEQEARRDGALLLRAGEGDDPAARADVLLSEAELLGDGAALVARLRAAGDLAAAGRLDEAAEVYAQIAQADAVEPTLADFAVLKGALLMINQADYAGAARALSGFVADDAPFRPLALEGRAAAYLGLGDAAAARADLQAALSDPGATQALSDRVRALLATLPPADGEAQR